MPSRTCMPAVVALLCSILLAAEADSARQYCCRILSYALPGTVSYPESSVYSESSRSYWSKQEESLAPSCIVTPNREEDVSIAVKTLALLKCKFAIRGGGHTPWANSANIDGGVTVDMRSMSAVTVNQAKTVASVGAGALWGDVYRKMDSLGLAVIGGRGSSIGVGGLLTGGGISYFSARNGFACDNVVNYRVVLASGTVVDANSRENSDLWLALKGGSNNFGVVTQFDLAAFPQGDFWGGSILYADSTSPQLLRAFADLNKPVGFDEYAALILSFSYVNPTGFFASANIEYTQPVTNPSTFQPFTTLQPQFTNSMRISNQTDFTTEFIQFQTNGRRQQYITNTFKNDLEFLDSIYSMFKQVAPQLSKVSGLAISLTIQPVPPAITAKSGPLGGNSMGLDPSDGALVLCLISATWDTATDDTLVISVAKLINARIVAMAKTKGLWTNWIYLNYADRSQDPISGYGAANQKHLRAVSAKYDPRKVFQKKVPGGFKLFRSEAKIL